MSDNNKGILDPEGVNNNPLTDKPYSDNYKELAKRWSKYPGYEMAHSIIQDIKDYQVLLVIGGTGSGKTVLLPKYALHALDYNGKIAITLPKQVITKTAATFAANTLDVKLGEQVGYQYKGSPKEMKSSDTKLLYATDGTIVQRLLNDPKLEAFDIVIIDEAHERKVQIDFLLYLLKNAISLRSDLKVIIMSATVNAEIFSNYFMGLNFKEINIAAQTNYPITSIFLDTSLDYNNVLIKGFEILTDILDNKEGDIIFFVTSQNETFDLCKKLDAFTREKQKKDKIFCVEVFAGMDHERQILAENKELYKQNGLYTRKVIFTTNVAESSLTIDGIMWVIDSGFELKSSYDPIKRAKILNRQLITHAQAKQRMGRTGRTGPGTCYHLYTKNDFENKMGKFPEPDIRTSDISSECLRLLALNTIETSEKLLEVLTRLIEPPKEAYIRDALTKLMQMGLIEGGKISGVGKVVAKISNEPMIGKTLLLSVYCDCSIEVTNIMALLDASNYKMGEIFTLMSQLNRIKYQYKNDKNKMNNMLNQINNRFKIVRKKFKHKYGDFNSLLKIYDAYNDLDKSKQQQFCESNFLKRVTLNKAKRAAIKISSDLKKYKELFSDDLKKELNINSDILNHEVNDRIIYCFLNGYYINRATIVDKNKKIYRVINSNGKAEVEKMSFIYNSKNLPTNIIYSEYFIMMDNANLTITSKIPAHIDKLL